MTFEKHILHGSSGTGGNCLDLSPNKGRRRGSVFWAINEPDALSVFEALMRVGYAKQNPPGHRALNLPLPRLHSYYKIAKVSFANRFGGGYISACLV
ncbi:hypothetical protein VNO77_25147 [Canavalia gladiata]|uniref:Uncharacterized protein n=1 Tax=Canavalia gladiata TaxID=3824 RepID=A0AAN9L8Y8_CANGL